MPAGTEAHQLGRVIRIRRALVVGRLELAEIDKDRGRCRLARERRDGRAPSGVCDSRSAPPSAPLGAEIELWLPASAGRLWLSPNPWITSRSLPAEAGSHAVTRTPNDLLARRHPSSRADRRDGRGAQRFPPGDSASLAHGVDGRRMTRKKEDAEKGGDGERRRHRISKRSNGANGDNGVRRPRACPRYRPDPRSNAGRALYARAGRKGDPRSPYQHH